MIEFKGNEVLWILVLCAIAERQELPKTTLPYKSRGALLSSDGKWGIVPGKMREMLDGQNQASRLLKSSGADG